jgi:SAM-dependent methyltransferase
MKELPKHLGGHQNKTHLDVGTLEFFKSTFNIKSMLDIGCGPGGMVNLAQEMDLYAIGVDGDFTINRSPAESFILHDFTLGPAPINEEFDLAWSCEFVEHVHEEYVPMYMPAFQQAKYVTMTYSQDPNGYHHVNLKPAEYWIKTFGDYGLEFNSDLTAQVKQATTMNLKKKKKAWVLNSGLCFVNTKYI